MIFGNTITEIPSTYTCCSSGCSKCECMQGKLNVGKKIFGNCSKAITENGRKKIVVAEITCEELKKKNATSTIFLQHFHNKSQV